MKIEVLLSALSLIISLAVFAISYLVYKRDKPTLNTQINILQDDMIMNLKKINQCPKTSSAGFFIRLQIANSGFRTITAMFVVDEKGETIMPIIIDNIDFGYTLKEGDTVSHISDISKDGIKLLKNANKIYIEDTAKRKHLVKSFNKSDLKGNKT